MFNLRATSEAEAHDGSMTTMERVECERDVLFGEFEQTYSLEHGAPDHAHGWIDQVRVGGCGVKCMDCTWVFGGNVNGPGTGAKP